RPDHLLAYRRSNPLGLENQVWKDSRTSYLFGDGTLPDFDAGIVSTERQGYAYDALMFAATLATDGGELSRRLAKKVQRSTLKKLWMGDGQRLCPALGVALHGH